MAVSERVRAWRARCETEVFRGRRINLFERPGADPPIVLLHGFPSSSFDWRALLEFETEHAVLAPDFLGFGLSEKPREHTYTLAWQADLVEELVRRRLSGRPAFLVAHDMGTSVATELLARDIEGALSFALAGALLFNGSIVIERASLTPAQRLLRSPAGPLAARLANERVFRREFSRLFSPAHPLGNREAEDQWALICAGGGRTLGHRLVHYLGERVRLAERWHGAIRDWDGPLSLVWGTLDPVATVAVLDALVGLRPEAPVEPLELGHYPQIEDPAAIAGALGRALARAA